MPERPVVIAGGGTGGHVYPGLALAGALRARDAGRPVTWIGARGGLEAELVPRAGLPITLLPLAGAARLGLLRKLKAGALAALATLRCLGRFLFRRPLLLVGVGGFASGPAALAALLLGVPTLLLEQNATPGVTNRLLARFAGAVASSFPDERALLGSRVVVTGNPVRPEIAAIAPRGPGPLEEVLAFGGSRGARSLNEAWIGALPLIERGLEGVAAPRFLLQTGPADEARVREAAERSALDVQVSAFLHDMPERLAKADLVVCRAGATTVAELCAAGRASILVPFPHAAGDHQRANARALERGGAALVIDPDALSPERLAEAIVTLAREPGRLDALAAGARAMGRPGALDEVVALASKVTGGAL